MSEPLDEIYFIWLYHEVAPISLKNPARTYNKLFRKLFTTEFVWIVPNDDNRVEDGRDLRYEFLREKEIDDIDPEWMGLGCSMLELLIGLSRRLSFEMDGEPSGWFWTLLENVGLNEFNDKVYISDEPVDEILNRVIFRTYGSDGHGGLFPLCHTDDDQRNVELWYQLSAWVMELD